MRTKLTREQHRFEANIIWLEVDKLARNGHRCMAHAKALQARWHERRWAEAKMRESLIGTGGKP